MLIATPSLLLPTSKLSISKYMVVLGLTGHFPVFEKALRLFSVLD